MTIKAFVVGLFKHPVRTLRERDAEMEAAMELVDAEFNEAVAELVGKFVARVRRLAGRAV
ncbi:hypothetical protein [Nonomuraea sp. CA-141351]|uniref:hypothetical protein n=1 Tax=Nonomuraea sp. CA-141351 TaxID=3239996 RepID=UPI003D910B89